MSGVEINHTNVWCGDKPVFGLPQMNALRLCLDGKRVDVLSAAELRQVVQECAAAPNLIKRAQLHLYVVRCIARKFITTDLLLPIAIAEVKTAADLGIVALAIRGGTSPNLYVQTPGVGPAHIIVYTVTALRTPTRSVPTDVLLSVILVLIILGAHTNIPAFDVAPPATTAAARSTAVDTGFLAGISEALVPGRLPLPPETPTPSATLGSLAPTSTGSGVASTPIATSGGGKTVQEWLRSQGLPGFGEDVSTLLRGLRSPARHTLGCITDRPDIIGDDIPPSLEDALAARATKVLQQYPVTKDSVVARQEFGEYRGIFQSVEGFNADAFTHFVDAGLAVTYFTINRLVLHLRAAFRDRDTTLTTEIQTMLQYAVSRGAAMDVEQLAIVNTTDEGLTQSLLTTYRVPQWRKVCATPALPGAASSLASIGAAPTPAPTSAGVGAGAGSKTGPGALAAIVPDTLRTLAFTVGLDLTASKATLCSDLATISAADAASLKNAAILRQKARVGAGVSTISEFIAGSVPAVACANRTALQTDPFEYNDAYMTFYKDVHGQVWCFTSNMYESLLSTPVNPHTSEPLPERFQAQLRAQLDILRRLGISPTTPVPIGSAIDALSTPDDVSSTESKFIADTIVQAAGVAGIDEAKLRRLTPAQMNQALTTINMERSEITLVDAEKRPVLTPEHRFITFARAVYFAIKDHPVNAARFFNSLRIVPT